MGSTIAFKITASLIKPTCEVLLDYCSYLLLVIALVGMARILIGVDDLKYGCRMHNISENDSRTILTFSNLNGTLNEFFSKDDDTKILFKMNLTEEKYCLKYRQAYYPYFVLIEAVLLLLTGILWVKMPKIQPTITRFRKLLHRCQNSSWCNILNNPIHPYLSTNKMLPALLKSEAVNMELNLLLNVLFNNETNYKDKSQARLLYEDVQKFCGHNEKTNSLCKSYIRKSFCQLLFWLVSFAINMYLFIIFEFYVDCLNSTSNGYCDHDEFLRVIWYMSQVVIIVYAICNSINIRWINGKFKINFFKSLSLSEEGKRSSVHCFIVGKRKIKNDMALLLHLVVTTKHRGLPYFTIFLFDQWKAKFSQIDNADNDFPFGHYGNLSTDYLVGPSVLSLEPSKPAISEEDSN